jgi:hypothetical protein
MGKSRKLISELAKMGNLSEGGWAKNRVSNDSD